MDTKHSAKGLTLCVLARTLTTSCMHMRIIAVNDSDNPVPKKETHWTYLWGLVQYRDIETDESCKSICKVTARTNFAQILVSAVTLGIAVPQTLWYECCPDEPEPDTL